MSSTTAINEKIVKWVVFFSHVVDILLGYGVHSCNGFLINVHFEV